MDQGLAGFSLLLILFCVVVGLLWIFVPFILMGTNKRLDRLIYLQNVTNDLLTKPVIPPPAPPLADWEIARAKNDKLDALAKTG